MNLVLSFKMRKRNFGIAAFSGFLALIFSLSLPQYANPVYGEKIVLTQPNGIEIIGYIYGDEFHRRVETEEGFTVILNEERGTIEYAIMKNKRLVPSGMIVGIVSPFYLQRIRFPKHLSDRSYQIAEIRKKSPEMLHELSSFQDKLDKKVKAQALTGTKKAFVVCVQFQAEATPPTQWSSGAYSPSGFDTRIFSTGAGNISMANYYKANSYNQFWPVGYTHPNWVTLPQTASWYKQNGSWRKVIEDAMDMIRSADPSFDFTLYANSGELNLILIWAGTRQTWGTFYWPQMSSSSLYKYGVTVRYYNVVNERNSNGTENTDISAFCHEYGHMTGCPDLYDYSSFATPLGHYCMMGWSNYSTHFCGYIKWRIYEWVTPTEITASASFNIDALGLASASNPRLYKVNIESPNEYFLLENRFNGSDSNYENYSYRWSGLLISHIDENYPPAVCQPSYPFYGVEAVVPVLNPSITTLSSYTAYYDNMVFSADYGYTRLEPAYPDDQPPGAYLTLTYSEGVEHVIYRNTQGHTKTTEIHFINIGNSGSTMNLSATTLTYAISGTVNVPSVSGSKKVTAMPNRVYVSELQRRLSDRSKKNSRTMAKYGSFLGKVNKATGLSGVVMSGLPGNPSTDASGFYSVIVEYNWSGIVTPTKQHYTFTPLSRTYSNLTSDQLGQDYSALRNIYAPLNFQGVKVENRSLLFREYINSLSWQSNPDNVDIVKYRIYKIEGTGRILVAEVSADTLNYWDIGVEKDTHYEYALCAVNNENREGAFAYLEID